MPKPRVSRKRPVDRSPEALRRLSDRDFIDVYKTAVLDRTDVNVGEFTIPCGLPGRTPPEVLDAVCAEVGRRGLSVPTAQEITQEAMDRRSRIGDLINPWEWRRYELHAAHALLSLLRHHGVQIDKKEFDLKVRVEGRKRPLQVDLMLTQAVPLHRVAFEMKDYKRTVPVGHLEQFVTRIKKLGVERGAYVTARGYQQGAREVAAQSGIDLFVFRELKAREEAALLFPGVEIPQTSAYWVLEGPLGAPPPFDAPRLLCGELTVPRRPTV